MATIKASENEFPEVLYAEGAAPATPSAGLVKQYAKADGLLYSKDDTGVETPSNAAAHIADTTDAHDGSAISVDPTGLAIITGTDVQTALEELDGAVGGAGSVAGDVIWDAAGDLAVGTGANTAARLAIGNVGGALSRINGAVAWNSGTSFPGSAASGDRFYRSDLAREFKYDGTRWVSMQVHSLRTFHEALWPISATNTPNRWPTQTNVGSDLWLLDCLTTFFISGGTALGASHKWVGVIAKLDTADSPTTLITVNIDSGSSNAWRQDVQSIGALLSTAASFPAIRGVWTKTGTPGTLRAMTEITYRIVAT